MFLINFPKILPKEVIMAKLHNQTKIYAPLMAHLKISINTGSKVSSGYCLFEQLVYGAIYRLIVSQFSKSVFFIQPDFSVHDINLVIP